MSINSYVLPIVAFCSGAVGAYWLRKKYLENQMTRGTVRMEIYPQKIVIARNEDQNTSSKAKQYTIKNHTGKIVGDFSDFRGGLNTTIRNVEIFIEKKGKMVPCPLSDGISKNLTTFFVKGRLQHEFNCIDFINLLFNKYKFCNLNRFTQEEWDIYLLSDRRLPRVNEGVCLTSNKIAKHFAVYLGHDLYLSLFGKQSPLVISSLKEMEENFQTNEVFIVIPKQPDISNLKIA